MVGNKIYAYLFRIEACEITNLIYFFFVLGGHYPLLLEVDADEKENVYDYFFSRTFYYLGTK